MCSVYIYIYNEWEEERKKCVYQVERKKGLWKCPNSDGQGKLNAVEHLLHFGIIRLRLVTGQGQRLITLFFVLLSTFHFLLFQRVTREREGFETERSQTSFFDKPDWSVSMKEYTFWLAQTSRKTDRLVFGKQTYWTFCFPFFSFLFIISSISLS